MQIFEPHLYCFWPIFNLLFQREQSVLLSLVCLSSLLVILIIFFDFPFDFRCTFLKLTAGCLSQIPAVLFLIVTHFLGEPSSQFCRRSSNELSISISNEVFGSQIFFVCHYLSVIPACCSCMRGSRYNARLSYIKYDSLFNCFIWLVPILQLGLLAFIIFF